MGLNNLSGTPWHTEKMHRAEGEEKRYKGRCKYFEYSNNYCTYYCRKCTGSSHCDAYFQISDEEFNKKQRARNGQSSKAKSDDDIYWY